jgi:hypothetical protein
MPALQDGARDLAMAVARVAIGRFDQPAGTTLSTSSFHATLCQFVPLAQLRSQ